MDPNLNIVSMAFESEDLAKLCKYLGVDPRGMSTTARNEAIKVALGALAGFMPLTNNERKTMKRKQKRIDELQAQLEAMSTKRETPTQAPRAAQPPRATQPQPVVQAAQPEAAAQQPLRAPRMTTPQPIARPRRVVEEPEKLPEVEPAAFSDSFASSFLASDDEDELEDREDLWAEALHYINTLKATGNQQKLARAKTRIQQLDIRKETITRMNLDELKGVGV